MEGKQNSTAIKAASQKKKIGEMLAAKKVLWINFAVLFGIYALCIFVRHTSPDFFNSMLEGNTAINLHNGRIFNWMVYRLFEIIGWGLEKNIVFSQLFLTIAAALCSYWVYAAFVKEAEDKPVNRVLIQLGSLIMFGNICFWEGWYAFPETVLASSFNLMACFGAFALFAAGVRTAKKRYILLSHVLALIAIFGYQVYVGHYIILTAIYLLCHFQCKAEKKSILYTVEVVCVSAAISVLNIFSNSLLVKLGLTQVDGRAANLHMEQILQNLQTLWDMQGTVWKNMKGFMPMYVMGALGILLAVIIFCTLCKKKVKDALWTGLVLLGCYVSIFLPHIVSSYIWAAPRTLGGLFCFAGAVLCLGASMLSQTVIKRIAVCVSAIFLVVSAVQIQVITAENIVSTRLDEIQIRAIQRQINLYEEETGINITTIAVHDDCNKTWGNETVQYCIMDTNLRIMSVDYANVLAINYYTGRNYKKRQMTEDEYQAYFDGESYDYFDAEDQLLLDNDTAYLLIY